MVDVSAYEVIMIVHELHLIEKVSDGRGSDTGLSTFRKTGIMML